MGIDYCRFRVTEQTALVRELINRQAIAFQSMSGWESSAASDVNGTSRAILENLHLATYLAVSKQLRSLIHIPDFDYERGCATDVEDLDVCWRVMVVGHNPIFPPLWRVQAYRTLMPDELEVQLGRWRSWIAAVTSGEHEQYLRWLHLLNTTDFLRYHWTLLRETAMASLKKRANWANTAEIEEVRQRIIRLREPIVITAPILPEACRENVNDDLYGEALHLAKTVNELTRSWNYHAKNNHRVPDYRSNYSGTVEEFRRRATDDWLAEFFVWAQRCADERCGLFLDY